MENAPIKVSIVEDDPKARKSLAKIIDSTEGLRCVGQHPSNKHALAEILLPLPDVVLMDINLLEKDGIDSVRRLKELRPETMIVILTTLDDTNIIFKALSAGAYGYLLKCSSAEQIILAIRSVYDGGSPMSGAIARRVVSLFHQNAVPDRV
jgi:DNA-binding NarL/FixJ family response regulator